MYSVAVTPVAAGRTLTKRNIVAERKLVASAQGRRLSARLSVQDRDQRSRRLLSKLRSLITLVPARVLKLHVLQINAAKTARDAATRYVR